MRSSKMTMVFAVLGIVMILLPTTAFAIKPKKFKHTYTGSWTGTFDTCDRPIGNSGALNVTLKKIKKSGKIKKANVKFSDFSKLQATGKIFFNKKKVRRIKLNYSQSDATYLIKAKLKKKSIIGKYDHTLDGCHWGGTVRMNKKKGT